MNITFHGKSQCLYVKKAAQELLVMATTQFSKHTESFLSFPHHLTLREAQVMSKVGIIVGEKKEIKTFNSVVSYNKS
jgi:hypothetical protein